MAIMKMRILLRVQALMCLHVLYKQTTFDYKSRVFYNSAACTAAADLCPSLDTCLNSLQLQHWLSAIGPLQIINLHLLVGQTPSI